VILVFLFKGPTPATMGWGSPGWYWWHISKPGYATGPYESKSKALEAATLATRKPVV